MLQSLDIVAFTHRLNLDVFAVWVRRENTHLAEADALSTLIDTDNWAVTPASFDEIAGLTTPFIVDLFATAANAKIPRFYTVTYTSPCDMCS